MKEIIAFSTSKYRIVHICEDERLRGIRYESSIEETLMIRDLPKGIADNAFGKVYERMTEKGHRS